MLYCHCSLMQFNWKLIWKVCSASVVDLFTLLGWQIRVHQSALQVQQSWLLTTSHQWDWVWSDTVKRGSPAAENTFISTGEESVFLDKEQRTLSQSLPTASFEDPSWPARTPQGGRESEQEPCESSLFVRLLLANVRLQGNEMNKWDSFLH